MGLQVSARFPLLSGKERAKIVMYGCHIPNAAVVVRLMAEPSSEQWLALHEAFREYCQAAPWRWFDDADLVAVEHPSYGHTGYCIVMGSGGMEYGLAVYRGDEGLAGYLALVSGAIEVGSLESLNATNALSAMLADREELPKPDRDIIRSLGLRYRGRGRWPIFQDFKPGYLPWRLEADDAEFLTMALRGVIEVASLVDKGELSFSDEDGPIRVLYRRFQDGEWSNTWEPLLFPIPPPAPDYYDTERVRQLAESKPRSRSVWELGIFYLHAPTREERGGRPHFPTLALFVHTDSDIALNEAFMGPGPTDADRQELLVKLLETIPVLPSGIVVSAPRLAQLVESVTTPLEIDLSVDDTPTLWDVREELFGFIDESGYELE